MAGCSRYARLQGRGGQRGRQFAVRAKGIAGQRAGQRGRGASGRAGTGQSKLMAARESKVGT